MKYLLFFLILCASCASFQPTSAKLNVEANEETISGTATDMNSIISGAVHIWLQNKMNHTIYSFLCSEKASWRKAARISMVINWFDQIAIYTDNIMWTNFYFLVEEIRWHSEFNMNEQEYLNSLKEALDTYKYKAEIREEEF